MATQRIAAGFRYIWYGVVNEDNKFIGQTTTAPAAGNQLGSGMRRLPGARTVPIGIPEAEQLVVSGDDEPLTTFEFDAEDLPSGVLEMAVRDADFEALVQGTIAHALGDLTVGVLQPRGRATPTINYLMTRRAKKWEQGFQGAKAWENLYIHSSTTKPLYTDITQREFTPYRYSINTSLSDRLGWSTVNHADYGTTSAALFPIDSDNPLYMQRFTGNNSQQNFTLVYPVISAAKLYVFVNDIRQIVTTDYTATNSTLAFVSAPGTDAEIVVLQEVLEADLNA